MSGYREGDTICAEATPGGRGGISVIRVSGNDAKAIVSRLFDRELPKAGRFHHGWIITGEADTEPLDDVVVSTFESPHSYTGEDVIEISTHGSPVIVAGVLETLYKAGARPADPGEFTLRAYLNGKIDLTQAEAVCDLIDAVSIEASRAARRQLDGGIAKACSEISTLIEQLLVYTELELDFSDEDIQLFSREEKLSLVTRAVEIGETMLNGYTTSRRLREGVKVVLAGAPNVGKSSIYNMLVGEDKAIVHASPGTTRDLLSSKAIIGGIQFEFFDTAGIRDNPGDVEDQGIIRALKATENADVVIEVESVDLRGFTARDSQCPVIRVTNKCDLSRDDTADSLLLSAKTGEGSGSLRRRLLEVAAGDGKLTDRTISRERHYVTLQKALLAIRTGREKLLDGAPDDMIAEEWREALIALDQLSGNNKYSSILNTIFNGFCIGK